MYTSPMMFPLDPDGTFYALEDEDGNRIGVGSREVVQTLLRLITTSPLMRNPPPPAAKSALKHKEPVKVRG